jgi:hypothetical protein
VRARSLEDTRSASVPAPKRRPPWGSRAFVNIDGFNTGEKTETYWAIRSYEIVVEAAMTARGNPAP